MENFVYDIPTKVYFGKGQIENLGSILPAYGSKVLLVYGGGSIKKNGIYDAIVKQLHSISMPYVELTGVQANPRIETVRKGVEIVKESGADVILAIGGGSVIDCAKVVGAASCSNHDAWDLVVDSSLIKTSLPIISVLTLAATGSEMDHVGVISNMELNEKIGTRHPSMRPKASILDPTFTFSVSKYQTASGTADILSHAMESYFSNVEAYFQDRMTEGLMKTVVHYGPIAYNDPENYEARANLMWASSWAINDFLKLGKMVGWSCHPIEHQLSAYYDITHGVGLAIVTPYWMEKVLNEKTAPKLALFALRVMGVNDEHDDMVNAKAGIEALRHWYRSMGIAQSLRDVGIEDDTYFDVMAAKAAPRLAQAYVPLSKEDIVDIYRKAL